MLCFYDLLSSTRLKELPALKIIGKESNYGDNTIFPFRLGVVEEVISVGTVTTGIIRTTMDKIVV